jgi:cellulose biosynthesis protein BcsQ
MHTRLLCSDCPLSIFSEDVQPPVRSDAKLRQASAHGKTIFEYDSHSKGADDYRAVTAAIIAQESGAPLAEPPQYVEETSQV